jgi:hypothetical protein
VVLLPKYCVGVQITRSDVIIHTQPYRSPVSVSEVFSWHHKTNLVHCNRPWKYQNSPHAVELLRGMFKTFLVP